MSMKKFKVTEHNCKIYLWSDVVGHSDWVKEFYDLLDKHDINRMSIEGKEIVIQFKIIQRGFKKDSSINSVEFEINV